jgi:phage-related protein
MAREYSVVANFIARTQGLVDGFNTARQTTSTFMNNFNSTMRSGQNSLNNFRAETEGQTSRIGKAFTSLKESLSDIAGAYIGFEAVKEGVKTLGESFISSNADMETYENTLTTVMKSHKKAVETLQWATKFAASTPFEIPEIVDATAKLTAYGINAKNVMSDIGNMASVMGKPLDQAVEAVADAQTGELERLKEFGITKQQLMNKSKELYGKELVNSKGQITDMQLLNKTLFAVMEERYKGGMDMASKSFKGLESNAEDAMGTLTRTLGKPVFDKFKQGLQSVVPVMSAITSYVKGDLSGASKGLVDQFGQDKANKIMDFFGKVKEGVQDAKKWILSFQPTIQNVITIFQNMIPAIEPIGQLLVGAFLGVAKVLPPVLNYITGIASAFTKWEGFVPVVLGLVSAIATYQGILKAITIYETVYQSIQKVSILLYNAQRAAAIAYAIYGGGLTGVLQGMRAAVVSLNLAFLANPIVLVIAAVVGLGVALVVAYQKSETFRNIVNGVWASIKDGFGAVIDWFTTTLPVWFNNMVSFFQKWGSTILMVITGPIGLIVGLIIKNWDLIKSVSITLWNDIVSGFQSFISFIMGAIQPFITFFVNSWTNLKLLVLSIVEGFFALLTGDFDGVKLALIGIITAFKDQFIAYWNLIKSIVVQVALDLWSGIKSGFSAGKDAVINTAIALYNGVINWFKNLFSTVSNTTSSIKDGIVNGFTSAKDLAVNAALGLFNGVVSWFKQVPDKAVEMKDGLINTLKNIDLVETGKFVIQGFINGIGSMASALWSKIEDIASGLKKKLQDALGIHSPSRVMMEIGKFVGQGLALGIDGTRTLVNKSAIGLAEASNFSNLLPSMTLSFNGLSNSLPASNVQKQPVNNQNTQNTYYTLHNVSVKTENASTFIPDLQRIIRMNSQ